MRIDPQDLAGPLDIDLVGTVDHDLGDRLVAEQRFQRTQTGHITDRLGEQPLAFVTGHGETARGEDAIDEGCDHLVGFGRRDVDECVEGLDDLRLKGDPGLVHERFARGIPGRPDRACRHDRDDREGLLLAFVGISPLSPLDPLHQRHDGTPVKREKDDAG